MHLHYRIIIEQFLLNYTKHTSATKCILVAHTITKLYINKALAYMSAKNDVQLETLLQMSEVHNY